MMVRRQMSPGAQFKRVIRGWSTDQIRAAIAVQESMKTPGLWELSSLKAELRRRQYRIDRLNRTPRVS